MDARLARVDRRPGTLWKVLQFPLTRLLLALLAIAAVVAAVQVLQHVLGLAPHSVASRLLALVLLVAVLAVYVGYVRLIERRATVELAPRDALPGLAGGFLTGTALFCATILVLWAAGAYQATGTRGAEALIGPLVTALLAGVFEELVTRAVLFRILEETLGSWLALAVTAALFGLLHLGNPGATLISACAIALEAGILLAAVYMATRTLWMCIGLHWAWNFAEGGIFGASVSGSRPEGLLVARFQGADYLTGGKFGPEASVPAVVVCLAAGIAFLVVAHRRGRILPPAWRRPREMDAGGTEPVSAPPPADLAV